MTSEGRSPDSASAITDSFIRKFERRARFLRATAALILLIVFGLLGLGAYVFLEAPDLASQDIAGGGDIQYTLEQVQTERDTARRQFEVGQRSLLDVLSTEKRLTELESKTEILKWRREQPPQATSPSSLDEYSSLEEVEIALRIQERLVGTIEQIKEIQDEMLAAGASTRSDSWLVELELVRAERQAEDLKLKHARFATQAAGGGGDPLIDISLSDAGPEPKSTTHLLQTNIYRFGALLVIFFFISILQPIFRYNTQLGAYYDARADMLLLYRASKDQDLDALAAVLTPGLKFEKTGAGAGQQHGELIKELISAAGRQDRK